LDKPLGSELSTKRSNIPGLQIAAKVDGGVDMKNDWNIIYPE
jgi:hypothetical protein